MAGEKSAWKISLWRKHLSQVKMLSLVPGEIQPRYKQKRNTQCWVLTGEVWIFGLEGVLLSWVWAVHTHPNLGLTYKTLENPSLEEKKEVFSCTENLIFMERGQLLCMRSTGALSHEAKSHVPNQPPCASSHYPSCRQLCSSQAHPLQPPRARQRESQSFVPTVQ